MPTNIRTPDNVNITGQSLNTIKFTLAPVNSERIVNPNKRIEQDRYTHCEDVLIPESIRLTSITNTPINMSVIPSIIHSIIIMFLLSLLISPKSFTTPLVAKR